MKTPVIAATIAMSLTVAGAAASTPQIRDRAQPPREAALGSLQAMTPSRLLAMARERLTGPLSEGASGLTSVRDGSLETAHNGGDDFVFVYPAEDLDGDGKQDLVVVQGNDDQQSAELIVRRGFDGSVISVISFPYYGYWTRADVTGDGLAEVITVEIEVQDSSIGAGVVGTEDLTFTQIVRVWSVQDGSLAWSATFDGTFELTYVSAVVDDVQISSAHGLPFGVFVEPDVSGDGVSDILVQLMDVHDYVSLPLGVTSYHTVSTGVSLAGHDGSEVARLVTSRSNAYDSMFPLEDRNGDNLAEVGVLTHTEEDQNYLSSYPPSGEEAAWTAAAGFAEFSLAGSASLLGARSSDLVYAVVGQDPSQDLLRGFSGEDGALLWEHQVSLDGTFEAGDIDGDEGTDYLSASVSFSDKTQVLREFAFAGSDGETLWGRTESAGPGELLEASFCDCSADLDGDGVADLLDRLSRYVPAGDEWVLADKTVRAISGATGGVAWQFPESPLGPPVAIDWSGDVTGNGTHDVWVGPSVVESGELETRFAEGSTGNHAWSLHRTVEGFARVTQFGLDVTGDGTAEVVLVTHEHDEEGHTTVTAAVYRPAGLLYDIVLLD